MINVVTCSILTRCWIIYISINSLFCHLLLLLYTLYILLYFSQRFREEVSREGKLEGEAVVSLIELLADVHGPCLQEMEARLERWESNARHNIGDFLYNTLLNVLPLYDQYLENLIPVLEKMEYYTRTSRRFDQLCRDFEAQKHCYLPLTSFLLKPLQRLLHYNSIIDSTFKSIFLPK